MNPRPSISYLRMKKHGFGSQIHEPSWKKRSLCTSLSFNCHTIIKHEKKTNRLYKQANYGQIIHDINSINWMSMISDDINDMLSMFNNKIKEIENKHVPMIEVTNKKKYSFSVDKNTRDKIK